MSTRWYIHCIWKLGLYRLTMFLDMKVRPLVWFPILEYSQNNRRTFWAWDISFPFLSHSFCHSLEINWFQLRREIRNKKRSQFFGFNTDTNGFFLTKCYYYWRGRTDCWSEHFEWQNLWFVFFCPLVSVCDLNVSVCVSLPVFLCVSRCVHVCLCMCACVCVPMYMWKISLCSVSCIF